MKKILVILLGLLITVIIAIVIIGIMIVQQFNRMINLRENINSTWVQVENNLQKRNCLIQNLINGTQEKLKNEKELLTDIENTWIKLTGAEIISEKIKYAHQMDFALRRLLIIIEDHPDIKEDSSIRKFLDDISINENRIYTERFRYNETVRLYNNTIQNFPGMIFASLFGFNKYNYYVIDKSEKNTH